MNGGYVYNGLDRRNNNKGYTHDNIVPCCKPCNYAKRDMNIEEFRNWVRRVYKNFIGCNNSEVAFSQRRKT